MLTREALFAWASVDDASITCRLARTALAYMHTLDAVIGERNEALRQRDDYELQIIDARDILEAAPEELLSDAAWRAVESSQVQREADRGAWTPRHGGGAVLTVGGVDVVEIEPLGPGWWIGAGWAGSDGFNGTLSQAKAHALAMLDRGAVSAVVLHGLESDCDPFGLTCQEPSVMIDQEDTMAGVPPCLRMATPPGGPSVSPCARALDGKADVSRDGEVP
jgi:hypothetical protein